MTDDTATEQATPRRTKRRYAHELYPHAEEGETRPLAVDVPYLYSRAVGLEVFGTGWFDLREDDELKMVGRRMTQLVTAYELALVADALLQGLAGDEAWAWAQNRLGDGAAEIVGERAIHYGVPYDAIKPYPCGPEPDHHDHYGEPNAHGWRFATQIDGKESECPECTEEIPAEVAS
jgi:hypothetical protein